MAEEPRREGRVPIDITSDLLIMPEIQKSQFLEVEVTYENGEKAYCRAFVQQGQRLMVQTIKFK